MRSEERRYFSGDFTGNATFRALMRTGHVKSGGRHCANRGGIRIVEVQHIRLESFQLATDAQDRARVSTRSGKRDRFSLPFGIDLLVKGGSAARNDQAQMPSLFQTSNQNAGLLLATAPAGLRYQQRHSQLFAAASHRGTAWLSEGCRRPKASSATPGKVRNSITGSDSAVKINRGTEVGQFVGRFVEIRPKSVQWMEPAIRSLERQRRSFVDSRVSVLPASAAAARRRDPVFWRNRSVANCGRWESRFRQIFLREKTRGNQDADRNAPTIRRHARRRSGG